MWLYDNFRLPRTIKWWIMTTLNVLFVLLGAFMMVAGTYGAAVVINQDLSGGKSTQWVLYIRMGADGQTVLLCG